MPEQRSHIVVNPHAGGGKVGRLWTRLEAKIFEHLGEAPVALTKEAGDAADCVQRAIEAGATRLLVVGGDGTINEAINGCMAVDATARASVGVLPIPVGTGADFVRSCGNHGAAIDTLLTQCTARPIDVGEATCRDETGRETRRYFVNVSSFGASGLVVKRINSGQRLLGGSLAYFVGTVGGLVSYKNSRVRLRIDDTFDETLLVNTVAIANGKYFGGGMKVAPDAALDDGLFDVVVVGDIGASFFLRHSRKLYLGEHTGLDAVTVLRGRRIIAEALDTNVWLDTDGEQPGRLPVHYELHRGALNVLGLWGEGR